MVKFLQTLKWYSANNHDKMSFSGKSVALAQIVHSSRVALKNAIDIANNLSNLKNKENDNQTIK